MSQPDKTISVCGTCCPLPLIQMAQAMEDMHKGDILEVTGDDPIFESGVRDYCEARGYEILTVNVQPDQTVMTIRL